MERGIIMKYIRTKDGQVNEPYKYDNSRHAYFCFPKNNEWTFYYDKDVIKVADTIEELCDEFVIYTPNMYSNMKAYLRYEFESKLDRAIQDYENYKDINEEVYLFGAIWTDKGLIYVAKMNESGELELL